MAVKPRFRIGSSALALITTAICLLATASPALASTGSVYFDGNENAAAGNPSFLFNGTFTGVQNVGLGPSVMPSLTTGSFNVATGDQTFSSDTTGSSNVATGFGALFANATGNNNVATGRSALGSATGDDNIALGFRAGGNLTTGSNNIDIGNDGKAGESRAIRIGTKGAQIRAFIAGVSGRAISGTTAPVLINGQGQLGTATAASAKTSTVQPLSAVVKQLTATVEHQQRQIRRQGKEIRVLRTQSG